MKSLFAVRDSKTEQYFPPFIAVNVGEAIRQFDQLCKNSETMIAKYPSDYALFHIAGFDELTGAIQPIQPVQVALALEYVDSPRRELDISGNKVQSIR